jgi:tetratricopeptide (TPR) repeat protein
MADVPPRELTDAIAAGRALIVCGAGVSRAATDSAAPGWGKLIKDGLAEATKQNNAAGKPWVKACEELLTSDEVADWLNAANTIQARLGGPSGGPYRAFFKQRLGSLKATHSAILRAIKTLADAGNRVATTNYDHLISRALNWDRADWTDHVRVIEALRGDPPTVWHIHGDYDHPPSIVFSQADYDRIVDKELPQFVQRSAGLDFTLVFVGCSGSGLSDDNVGRLLEWLHAGFAGLGDKHFILVSDDNKDKWPAGVTAVRFGAHDNLPAYLETLAPPPRAGATFPPDPRMIGRADRRQELVAAILGQERPILVPGALGMGKTTLALAAAYDPAIVARFGAERRFFVNLEPVPDAEGLLRALANALELDASGAAATVERAVADFCAAGPALAILDNFETPWRKEKLATEAMLGRLAAIKGLRLIVTARDEPPHIPGGGMTLRDVESLAYDDARALFLREAGPRHAADPALRKLLEALDGHPLSIELLAANAAGKADLKSLAADWGERHAAMLQRGDGGTRLTSLRVSLDISLAALGADSAAHRLLRLIALLPAGMAAADCAAALADGAPTEAERGAAARLEAARLVSRRDNRWRLLAPVREALLQDYPPEAPDKARLVKLFLARASLGRRIGTADWDEVRESVTAEAGNFDAMIGVAASEAAPPDGFANSVQGLAQFQSYTGLASVASLRAAAASLGKIGDVLGEANCVLSLGDIALARSDHDGARERYEAALPLYHKVGAVLGEANCIYRLGDIALRRSDHDGARERYEAALPLYHKVGAVLGEANCIRSLGDIALRRSDHDGARERYEAALPLYRRVGDVLGEASSVARLGEIALARSDHGGARERYEAALQLFRKVGAVLGEANCISSLGDIALRRSDHDSARERYEAALPLYRRVGDVLGEASSVARLGEIALARSDHGGARKRYEAALPLFRKVGDVLGEANCIYRLGDIALRRSDHDTARERYEAALPLYRKVGAVLGEANCIQSLGNIALARSDHNSARERYEAALPLYRKVGDVLGEAGCIRSLGDIALARSDHDGARGRYEAALPLYCKVGDVQGEANCIQRLGDVDEANKDIASARRRWNEALALYGRIPHPHSIGGAHHRLARVAATPAEAAAHREAARRAWASIGRADLIAEHLDKAP